MHLDIAALHLVTPSQMSAQSSQTARENIQQLHLRDNATWNVKLRQDWFIFFKQINTFILFSPLKDARYPTSIPEAFSLVNFQRQLFSLTQPFSVTPHIPTILSPMILWKR